MYEDLQLRDFLHGSAHWNYVRVNINRTDVGEEILDLIIEEWIYSTVRWPYICNYYKYTV